MSAPVERIVDEALDQLEVRFEAEIRRLQTLALTSHRDEEDVPLPATPPGPGLVWRHVNIADPDEFDAFIAHKRADFARSRARVRADILQRVSARLRAEGVHP